MTVGGGKILKELEGLPGGRAWAEAPEKLADARNTSIADPYLLSRITCKYLSCCQIAAGAGRDLSLRFSVASCSDASNRHPGGIKWQITSRPVDLKLHLISV